MLTLAAGLLLLLCLQQLHNVAALRTGLIGKYGLGSYRIGLGALGLAGVALVLAGKSHAAYAYVWLPPVWLHLFVLPTMFVAFIFVAAEVVPSNLRRLTRRPFLWGMVLWAITHLMVKGDLAAMSLFGGFGLLAILELIAVRRRGGHRPGKAMPWANESLTVAVGGLMFIAFYYLHADLFGTSASMLERSYF